ncbi:MAG: hypothetical protein Q9171_004769 [Xanthocarpia ochracea]
MPRPRAQDTHEDEYRGSGRRDKHVDDHDEDDQPEYEHEERPRRTKSDKKPKPRHVSEDEEDEEDEDEEDEDEDDHRHKKQLEVARKKRDDSSEESSEEETKRKEKKKKKKSKSREEETIRIDKWELVHRSEVDPDFVQLVADELGHHVNKILEGIEKDYLRRHTQTGLYNIDRFFENHMFGKLDKQNWERVVKRECRDFDRPCGRYMG